MPELNLKAKIRNEKEKPKILRKAGMIPAVVYGHKIKNISLNIDQKSFKQVFSAAGESALIDLAIEKEKKPRKVLIKEAQTDPVSSEYLHIDFYEVKMTEKITAEVPLEFRGVSPAVKDLSGVLVKNIDKFEVSCFPQDLPHSIPVLISSLKTFEDAIHIKDLEVPDKVEVLARPEDVVASVTPPRSEEELAELEEKVEEKVEEVEGVKKEEPESGEAAPSDAEVKKEEKKEEKSK